jgi:tetratricopeptide (TPR) repeat protein
VRIQVLGLLLLTTSHVLAQATGPETRRAELMEIFRNAEIALTQGEDCAAAVSYRDAGKAADRLQDNDARFVAALGMAYALETGNCAGMNAEEAYAQAHALAVTGRQKALEGNSYALFLFGKGDRVGAIEQLRQVELEFEKYTERSSIERREMAVYQYNLATIYASNASEVPAAMEEFKKALWNRPGYADAADAAFEVLQQNPRDLEVATQGAEIVTLMQITGQTEPAIHHAVRLLTAVPNDPQAEVLLGALLRCFLALPIDARKFHDEWAQLTAIAGTISRRAPRLSQAIEELHRAYAEQVNLYSSPTEASRAFGAWIQGPSAIQLLANLLRKRGVDEHNPSAAMACYAAAWFLDPANTKSGLLLAALLHAHRDLDTDHSLAKWLLDAYVPPVSKADRLISWFEPDPAREQFQHSSEDWFNIRDIYLLLTEKPREDVLREINRKAEVAQRQADRPKASRIAQAFAGQHWIGGLIPKEIDADAVYIEVGRQSPHGASIQEVALANVDRTTRRYSAELLHALAPGDSLRVYAIRLGRKSEKPINKNRQHDPRFDNVETVQSGGFVNLRNVHSYVGGALDATAHRALANLGGAFEIAGDGTFRLRNRGQPYLPRKGGYLISSFAGFSLSPFSLAQPNGSLKQVDNARSFEAGIYTPIFPNLRSWYFKGDFYSAFLAPIVYTGFHAAGAEEARVFYKYAAGGVRMGAFRFARYGEKVPELKGFLDITVGEWQNLETFSQGYRKLPVRLQIHGEFSIMGTAAYAGFLRTVGPGPNDFRLFTGFRFDLSHPLSRIPRVVD